MVKALWRAAPVFFLVAMLIGGSVSAVSVEQAQVCMPDIDVYLYDGGDVLSGIAEGEITAALDGAALSVRSLVRAEQGIFYVYMIDVSASMPAGHFSAAKQAVLEAWGRLRDQDTLALITFGNTVDLRLEGGESRAKVTETLDSLKNTDTSTKFYDAMDVLIDTVLQTEDMRRVAVVISDGIDDTDAGMTQEALEEKLIRTGVSISAMCIDTAPESGVAQFGDFIRLSGGELYIFEPADAGTVLDSLLDRLEGGWHLALQAPTNVASGEEALLNIDFGDAQSITLPVVPERWIPDSKQPRVESVVYAEGENAFLVTFSEAVTGVEADGVWMLADGNGEPVAMASVDVIDGVSCRLTMASPPPEGSSLTLTVSGLRDVSMESNELYRYSEVVWSGNASPPPADTAFPADEEPIVETGTLIIIGASVVFVVAAAVMILRMAQKKAGVKKEKRSKKQKKELDTEKPTAKFMFVQDKPENKR
mgnify:FL=1